MTTPTDDRGQPLPRGGEPRGSANEPYYYRRRLDGRDLLEAAWIGAGVGVVAVYIAMLLLQRTPLEPPRAGQSAARGASGGRQRPARAPRGPDQA